MRTLKKKNLSLVAILIGTALILPTHFVQAGIFDIGSFAQNAVYNFLTFTLVKIFDLVGNLMALIASGLNYAIWIRAGGEIPVVSATWKILRDFSNMIFIVLLIWMAFATIFDNKKYSFQQMIGRFIIIAVLINFSLVIGNLIIDGTQILTNVFATSIGNLGDRLGQFLNPGELLPQGAANVVDSAGGGLISVLFALILACIYLFSMAVALAFMIIRIPYIWGLLIISPLAWMSHILPSTEGWWKKWWGQFWGWNLFLPVYLFFIYLGLIFLSQRNEVINSIVKVQGGGENPLNAPLLGGLTNSLTFNLLFFYIFAAAVMIGGLWAAKSTTSLMGTGFSKGVDMAKGWVKRTRGFSDFFAAKKAAGERFGQFQQQGFKNPYLNKVYGGEAAQKRLEARWKERFGVKGAGRQFIESSKEIFEKTKEDYDSGKIDIAKLRDLAEKSAPDSPQGFAYRKLLLEKGAMDNAMFKTTLLSLKEDPLAIGELVKLAKDKKFAGIRNLKEIALDDQLSGPTFIPAKRDMLQYIASNAKFAASLNIDDVRKSVSILGGKDSPETRKFLDDLNKTRPDLVFAYKNDPARGGIYDPIENKVTTKEQFWTKVVRTEAKNLVEMPKDVWNNPDFQLALRARANELKYKSRRNFKNSLEKMLIEKGEARTGRIDDKNRRDKLDILDRLIPDQGEPENDNEYEDDENNDNGGANSSGGTPPAPGPGSPPAPNASAGGRGQGTGNRPVGFRFDSGSNKKPPAPPSAPTIRLNTNQNQTRVPAGFNPKNASGVSANNTLDLRNQIKLADLESEEQ